MRCSLNESLRPDSRTAFDSLLWLGASVLLLSLTKIGFLSGDALAHSAAFSSGKWFWNPNHLLIEPISAWWHGATLSVGIDRPGIDRLKLLSALSGGTAAALFRLGPARFLSSTRAGANHATAWLVGVSAFLRLLVSGETHMLQMPALVVVAWMTGALLLHPHRRTAWLAGISIGVSALFYISNLLLALTLPLVALWNLGRKRKRIEMRHVWPIPVAAGLVTGGGLLVAWALLRPPVAALEWVLSYAGGGVPESVSGSYGASLSLKGLMESAARTAYGAVSAVVDLSPLVDLWRGQAEPSLSHLAIAVAALSAAGFLVSLLPRLFRREDPAPVALQLAAGFVLSVVLFGLYWNNSDDQFFFQISVATGILVAAAPPWRSRAPVVALTLSLIVLCWNVLDTVTRFVLYPREERVELLRSALDGADLVVLPGQDEADRLLYFVDPAAIGEKLALTSLMSRYQAEEGLDSLTTKVDQALSVGGQVDVVGLYDSHLAPQPWRALTNAGYSASRIRALLEKYVVEVRDVGPFTIGTVSAREPDPTGGNQETRN